MIGAGIFGGIIIVLIFLCILMYNSMVRGKNTVEEAWSGIAVQLKRRHDLIPRLVNTVKGYAAHENAVFVQVTEARAASIAAANKGVADIESIAASENMLSRALKSLFAVAEAYPELRASENFMHLQDTLNVLEDEIQMSRRYYNGTARAQNNRILQFPGNVLAGIFGFQKTAYFELSNEAEADAPAVQF